MHVSSEIPSQVREMRPKRRTWDSELFIQGGGSQLGPQPGINFCPSERYLTYLFVDKCDFRSGVPLPLTSALPMQPRSEKAEGVSTGRGRSCTRSAGRDETKIPLRLD